MDNLGVVQFGDGLPLGSFVEENENGRGETGKTRRSAKPLSLGDLWVRVPPPVPDPLRFYAITLWLFCEGEIVDGATDRLSSRVARP